MIGAESMSSRAPSASEAMFIGASGHFDALDRIVIRKPCHRIAGFPVRSPPIQ
jgi:hypothetical protein